MKKSPLIGVVPLWDEKRQSIWMLPGYLDGILVSGGIPFILPLTSSKEVVKSCLLNIDGILFTGGHDISPALYNAEKKDTCGDICSVRDDMEQILFNYAMEHNMPIFGICRGIQLFNVCLGGTLYQDIGAERISDNIVCHKQIPPYDVPIHKVTAIKNSPLEKLVGDSTFSVNSYHHQAIKYLSPHLSAMAFSEDGLIESVYCPAHSFLWAVQWHPEFALKSPYNKLIFKKFISACQEYRM